ncbi:MAG: 7TM-DISM domain-containing protein, partial [Bacteroidota bacterium]
MRRILWVWLCLSGGLLSAQNALRIDTLSPQLDLIPYLELFADTNGILGFDDARDLAYRSPKEDLHVLSPELVWWVRFQIDNQLDYPSKWILYSPTVGQADIRVLSQGQWQQVYRSGRYVRATEKPFNQGDFIHVPLQLAARESVSIYMRLEELSLNPINLAPILYEQSQWYSVDQNPRGPIIIFFQGIFWIMIIYNLVLFFSI